MEKEKKQKELRLSVGELVSIFRNRKGMTQLALGTVVFGEL